MHPRTQEIIDYLDASHVEFKRALASIPHELHNRKPGPDRWSVSEVVEHVSLVEKSFSQKLIAELNRARDAGIAEESDSSPVVPTFDATRAMDRSQPLVAPEAVRPHGGLDTEVTLATLDEHRNALRSAIIGAEGLALGDVIMQHGKFGPLNLYQWSVFAAAHETRHVAQIREIGSQLA
jgi:hypothetical protein